MPLRVSSRVFLPRSLRHQFLLALSLLALLVLAGGVVAIYALNFSTAATRQLAGERLLRLQQAQDLVQNALLIERESQGMLLATTPGVLRGKQGELLARLEIHDQLVDALGAAADDISVLDLHGSGQQLRNTANVVAQLMETAQRADQAFAQAIAVRSARLQEIGAPGVGALAVLLLRLEKAVQRDEVMALQAQFVKRATGMNGLHQGFAPASQGSPPAGAGGATVPADDPFSLRLDLLGHRQALAQFRDEHQRQVIATVESAHKLSASFTRAHQNAMQELVERSKRDQVVVVILISASLILAWLVARFFLGRHVLARLQQVSHFLRLGKDQVSSTRVPVQGEDEIGEMARAVEHFLEARQQLAEANEQLAQAKTGLEAKVAERTEALRYANEHLMRELGERKRAESELARVNRCLRMLSDSNQTLIHVTEEAGLLDQVCRIVVEVGGYYLAWVGFARHGDVSEVWPVAHAGGIPADLEACRITWCADDETLHPVVNALATGHPCLGRQAAAEEAASQRTLYALPLTAGGRTLGILCIESLAADAFNDEESAILEELAGDLAFGLSTLHARAEHDQAEAALVRSERNLRGIYENTPLAYQALDGEGNFIDVNPAWCAMLGLERSEVIGRKFADFLVEGGAETLDEVFRRFQHQGEVHGYEFEIAHKDGSRLEVELDCKAGYDEAGGFQRAHCILHDITRRKEVERVMMHHAAIVESSNDAIVSTTLDGIITSWNDSAEQMLGYRRQEVLGQHVGLLIPESLGREEEIILGKIGAGVAIKHYHTLRRHKNGQLINVSITISPLRDAEGNIVGAAKIARDITEQKRAEQELRLAATAFESQEGMLITDGEGTILRVNKTFSAITGYPAEEVVGRKASLLKSGRHDEKFFRNLWQTVDREGAWHGEIWNRRQDGGCFPAWLTVTAVKGETGQVTHYVGTLTDITQRKEAEEEIRELAFYDQLTHLPNRRLLMDRLQRALASANRSQRAGGLLFIDLDNFKTLNDTFGHDHGDLLLREVAQRLGTCIRDGDTVARLGGDEFVVMIEDLSTNRQEAAEAARVVSEKILAALDVPYQLAGHEHHSTPSIGVTLFAEHPQGVDELLKQADIAMYQAKAAGRNTVRFFDPEMQHVLTNRASLEMDLRQALAEGQFLLYYQPQVDAAGRITGAEALVRWRHPVRGIVSPAEFIPLAEDTGLILPLGQWVLETACRQLVIWGGRAETADLTLAVNVSARQYRQEHFVDQVLDTLRWSGSRAERLELELTESLLLDDVEDTIIKMTALKNEGVRFSLDDFGTGYSSLAYLKRLPLSQLKIDQSFVRDVLSDPNDAAIARTVVALGQSLGLDVIAEGVESQEQRDFLYSQGCYAYQGYLFGRPLPADEFDRQLGLLLRAADDA